MQKFLFLVGSAIHTDHGVHNTEQRWSQTLDTIKSINKFTSHADIILIDASAKQSITQEEMDALKDKVKYIVNLHGDPDIQNLYKMTNNHDIVKNYSELMLLNKSLAYLNQNKLLEGYDKIFK